MVAAAAVLEEARLRLLLAAVVLPNAVAVEARPIVVAAGLLLKPEAATGVAVVGAVLLAVEEEDLSAALSSSRRTPQLLYLPGSTIALNRRSLPISNNFLLQWSALSVRDMGQGAPLSLCEPTSLRFGCQGARFSGIRSRLHRRRL